MLQYGPEVSEQINAEIKEDGRGGDEQESIESQARCGIEIYHFLML